jgi:hypothetical protein
MPLVSGIRAAQVNRFWEASLAWKGVKGYGDSWTFQDMIDRLTELRCLQGVVAYQADALLDDVIKDQRRRQVAVYAQLFNLHNVLPIHAHEPKSMVS